MVGNAKAFDPGVLDAARRMRRASVRLLHHAESHDQPAASLATAIPLQLRLHRLHRIELGCSAAARLDFVSPVPLVPWYLLAEHLV
eukprot:1480784-Prymnesium_polylepis.1